MYILIQHIVITQNHEIIYYLLYFNYCFQFIEWCQFIIMYIITILYTLISIYLDMSHLYAILLYRICAYSPVPNTSTAIVNNTTAGELIF